MFHRLFFYSTATFGRFPFQHLVMVLYKCRKRNMPNVSFKTWRTDKKVGSEAGLKDEPRLSVRGTVTVSSITGSRWGLRWEHTGFSVQENTALEQFSFSWEHLLPCTRAQSPSNPSYLVPLERKLLAAQHRAAETACISEEEWHQTSLLPPCTVR